MKATEDEEFVAAVWLSTFLHAWNWYLWNEDGYASEEMLARADARIRLAQQLHTVNVTLRAAYDLPLEPW